jgi:hypothetical protein
LNTQSANLVFAGPSSGAAAVPTFRVLTTTDIPNLATSKITTGVFSIARGGTGLSSLGLANQLIRVNASATALEYFSPNFLTGNQNISLSGDVTGSGTTSIVTTISNNSVTYAKLQDVTASRLLGRYSSTNGDTQEITIGSGLILNNTTGVLSATGGSGTVTSVGLSLPSIFSVSGSPVTTSGNLTAALITQGANLFFSSPNGTTGTPLFRSITNNDLPDSGVSAGIYNNVTVNVKGVVTAASNITYVVPTRSITLLSSTGISISSPATQDLSVNRTWTITNTGVTSVNGNTGDVTVAPAAGGSGYIQNQFTAPQTNSSFWASGEGRSNVRFSVLKDGSNSLNTTFTLLNAAGNRGAGLQLNADVNPGLSTWIHNGTSWIKRVENFATGLTAFYPSSGEAIRMVSDVGFLSAYNSAGTTRTGYLQFNTGGASVLGVDVNQGLSFATNGTVRQTITADGNVGIAATATERLTVGGNILANGGNGIGFTLNGPSSIVRDNSIDIKINTNRVGINNTGPAATTLDVNGDMRTTIGLTTPIVMSNSSAGVLSLIGGAIGAASTRGGQIDLYGGSAAAPNAGDIVFRAGLGGFGAEQAERMRIDATGNVGIGITAAAKLDVNGLIFSRTVSAEAVRAINDGAYYSFYNSTNSTRTGYLQMNTIGGAIFAVELNQPMSLRTNNQERIFIEAAGDVGIGIHTPGSKLDVNGQITIRGGAPGTGKILVCNDSNGLASWGNNTPAPAIIQGNGALSEIPSTWVSVILQHTVNNGFTSLANYPGGYTGRVVTLYNPTNFTFQLSSVTYPAKSVVYILWTSPTTPSFMVVQ